MADKQVTVDVPEDRVPEFYLWFAAFLAAPAGSGPPRGGPFGGGPFGRAVRRPPRRRAAARGPPTTSRTRAGSTDACPSPRVSSSTLLIATPGERHSGNELAARLAIEKGAHGLAGILAWPGRWCRKLGRDFPIATTAREDGGTDYAIEPEIAELFTRARTAAR